MTDLTPELRRLCRDTLRFLAADAVEKANSGHPGTPMGAADIATVLWAEVLSHDPSKSDWPNRDRFVLSGGHASALLYSLLHLSGYDLPLDEIKQFRQWGSKTPGHPEFGHTHGVEMTTGPLGAGFSTAVGMALAAKMMAARFNTEAFPLIDCHIIGICGDGDLQEGVASEAASLAGHLGLGNLIFVYDNNDITIEGHLDIAIGEDVKKRFEAYGWRVLECDGHDQLAVKAAMDEAKSATTEPVLIIAKTVIGAGAPTKAGTHSVHGSPLGEEELTAAKKAANWTFGDFGIPAEARAVFEAAAARGKAEREAWEAMFAQWREANPTAAKVWDAHWSHWTPEDFVDTLVAAAESKAGAATRNISGAVIQAAAEAMPALIGGAADLEPSTKTGVKGKASVVRASVDSDSLPDISFAGQNLHFGIREHAMGSIANGMVLFGSWLTYNATFLVFSDYMRPPIRLAALSHIPTLFIYTHDSFFVGEDGPTHQPIEHVASLRLMPGLDVWRPGDALETAMAWAHATLRPAGEHPSVLVLTRQKVATLERPEGFTREDIWKGGYVVADASSGEPAVTLIATGSEAGLAQAVRKKLEAAGTPTRFVSMPCVERFEAQSADYQASVVPASSRVVCFEAGATASWYKYAGRDGLVIGMDRFGASAPGNVLAEKFGFTLDTAFARIQEWLG